MDCSFPHRRFKGLKQPRAHHPGRTFHINISRKLTKLKKRMFWERFQPKPKDRIEQSRSNVKAECLVSQSVIVQSKRGDVSALSGRVCPEPAPQKPILPPFRRLALGIRPARQFPPGHRHCSTRKPLDRYQGHVAKGERFTFHTRPFVSGSSHPQKMEWK